MTNELNPQLFDVTYLDIGDEMLQMAFTSLNPDEAHVDIDLQYAVSQEELLVKRCGYDISSTPLLSASLRMRDMESDIWIECSILLNENDMPESIEIELSETEKQAFIEFAVNNVKGLDSMMAKAEAYNENIPILKMRVGKGKVEVFSRTDELPCTITFPVELPVEDMPILMRRVDVDIRDTSMITLRGIWDEDNRMFLEAHSTSKADFYFDIPLKAEEKRQLFLYATYRMEDFAQARDFVMERVREEKERATAAPPVQEQAVSEPPFEGEITFSKYAPKDN